MVSENRDHREFLQLTARLRQVAETHGDGAFAGALGECVTKSLGGDPTCPIAGLLLQDHAATVPPTEPPPQTLAFGTGDLPAYDRRRLLDYIHRALEQRAVLKGDTPYVEALRRCQKMIEEDDACPVHRVLKQPWP